MLYCNVSVKVLDTIPGSQYIKLITKQQVSENAVSDIIDMVQKIILKSRHNLIPCGSEDLTEGSLVLLNIPVFERVNSIWTRGQIIGRSELVDHVGVLLCDFGSINYEVPVYQLFKFVHAIPTLQTQFELCYLADATPLGPAGYSKACMEYLNNLVLNKEVRGTAWREKGKVTLLRPHAQPNGRLVTEILAENNLIRLVQFFPHGRTGAYPGKTLTGKSGSAGLPIIPPKPAIKPKTKLQIKSSDEVSEKKSSESKLSDTCSNETGSSDEDRNLQSPPFFSYQNLSLEGRYACIVPLVENGPWQFSAVLNNFEEIDSLLENVKALPVTETKVTSPVLLKKEGKYYRASIASEAPELKVWLVDIGAYEVVKKEELFVTPQPLVDIPARYVHCKLQGLPRTINPSIIHSFEKIVEDREFDLVVGKVMPNGVHKVYLELNGHSVCKLCCQTIYDQSSLVSGCEVCISHVCEDTGLVYLQMQEKKPLLDLLQNTIEECLNDAHSLVRPFMYQPCLRYYDSGSVGYRALVVGDGVDAVKVSMVDLGREELVQTEQLKTIPVPLVGHSPAYAIPCILPQVNTLKQQSQDINKWAAGKRLFANVLGYVNMLVHGVRKQVQKVAIKDCDTGTFLHQYLNRVPKDSSVAEEVIQEPASINVDPVVIVEDTLKSCIIRSWGSSHKFTVNLVNSKGANVLDKYLAEAVKIKIPEVEVEMGHHYLYNSEIGMERIKTVDEDNRNVIVQRVDNGESLTIPKNKLLRCPEYLSPEKVVSQAIECVLIDECPIEERPIHLVGQKVKIHFAEKEEEMWKVEILRVSNLLHESRDMTTSDYNRTDTTLKDTSYLNISMKQEQISRDIAKKKLKPKIQPILEIFDEVVVSSTEEYVIWVQRMIQTNELLYVTSLIKELRKEADLDSDTGATRWSVGDICIAQSPHTNSWYRGLIKKINCEEIKVHFIDYGDELTLPISRIIKSTPRITEFPPLAYKCKIINADDVKPKISKIVYQVSEMIDYDQIKETYEICVNIPKTFVWIPNISEDLYGFPSVQFVYDVEYEVQPAQIHDNGLISVHLLSQKEAFNELTASIAEGVDTVSTLTNAKIGSLCLGKYTLDGLWYRATIMKIYDDKAVVRYMDYGNSEDLLLSSLKELPKKWAKIPAQAIVCGIYSEKFDKIVYSYSLQEHKEIMDYLILGNFRKVQDGLILENCYVNGTPFCDILEEANILEESLNESTLVNSTISVETLPPINYQTNKRFTARISHVDNEETIYFQALDCDPSTMIDACADAVDNGQAVRVENPTKDVYYLGWDQMWYRCRLIDTLENNKYKVNYIDYGMNGVLDQLYTLPSDLLTQAPLASKCILYPPAKSEGDNSVEAYLCGREIDGFLEREYANYILTEWKLVDTQSPCEAPSAESSMHWFGEPARSQNEPECKIIVDGIKGAAHSSPSEDRRKYGQGFSSKGWDSADTTIQATTNLCSLNNSKTSVGSLVHFADNVRASSSSEQRTSTFNMKSPRSESSRNILGASLSEVNPTPHNTPAHSEWGTQTTGFKEVTNILKELSMSAQKAINKLVEPVSGEHIREKDRHELLGRLQSLVSISTPTENRSISHNESQRDRSLL